MVITYILNAKKHINVIMNIFLRGHNVDIRVPVLSVYIILSVSVNCYIHNAYSIILVLPPLKIYCFFHVDLKETLDVQNFGPSGENLFVTFFVLF